MTRDSRDSYVKNCVINKSFNRAIGLSGVQNLAVEDNVIYQPQGHGIFTGYGVESDNVIRGNLVIDTRRSWLLQESDIHPAGFYLTSPGNPLTANRAAGSDSHGYQYDLPRYSTGPLFSLDICPAFAQFSTFMDNVAHSN